MSRIYISPPHMSGREINYVMDAFASNWIAPLGPHVDAFEREFSDRVEIPFSVALSSGTGALHLAIKLLGLERGEEVICPSLTFSATINAAVYEGALPVLIDSDRSNWNMDPILLSEALESAASKGKLPKAVISVDLYGQSADHDAIGKACGEFSVPVIEDAAEALGATYKGYSVGRFGSMGVFSFNGNKIITTSGGGMLVSFDDALIKRARFLATQARDPAPHYQHSTIGYNYRMSNILAAIGRGQLMVLDERIAARRKNYETYVEFLGDLPGLSFIPEAPYGRCNRWLTVIQINPAEFGATREDIRIALEAEDIESRPVWKPMHLQPVFSHCRVFGGAVCSELFDRGLCLPSGSNLTRVEIERVSSLIRKGCKAVS